VQAALRRRERVPFSGRTGAVPGEVLPWGRLPRAALRRPDGFLPWDYRGTDDDMDGVPDMVEMMVNELSYF